MKPLQGGEVVADLELVVVFTLFKNEFTSFKKYFLGSPYKHSGLFDFGTFHSAPDTFLRFCETIKMSSKCI